MKNSVSTCVGMRFVVHVVSCTGQRDDFLTVFTFFQVYTSLIHFSQISRIFDWAELGIYLVSYVIGID